MSGTKVETPNGQRAETPYKLTAAERAATKRVNDRRTSKASAPRFKFKAGAQTTQLEPDHPDMAVGTTLLCDAFATGDPRFAVGLAEQVANAARTGKEHKEIELNFILATVKEIGPRDGTEALLASQMAAIHNATMKAASLLNHVETITQQDSASNMLNKLARTFAAQVEALKRYRSSGEQKVTVNHQHVNVSAEQAVVGVTQGGGGTHENSSQSHAPGSGSAGKSSSADERSPALLGHQQAFGVPMPGAGSEGQERLSHAWRQGRSTEG